MELAEQRLSKRKAGKPHTSVPIIRPRRTTHQLCLRHRAKGAAQTSLRLSAMYSRAKWSAIESVRQDWEVRPVSLRHIPAPIINGHPLREPHIWEAWIVIHLQQGLFSAVP